MHDDIVPFVSVDIQEDFRIKQEPDEEFELELPYEQDPGYGPLDLEGPEETKEERKRRLARERTRRFRKKLAEESNEGASETRLERIRRLDREKKRVTRSSVNPFVPCSRVSSTRISNNKSSQACSAICTENHCHKIELNSSQDIDAQIFAYAEKV